MGDKTTIQPKKRINQKFVKTADPEWVENNTYRVCVLCDGAGMPDRALPKWAVSCRGCGRVFGSEILNREEE